MINIGNYSRRSPRNPGRSACGSLRTRSGQPRISRTPTACEKINVPGGIASNITRVKRHHPLRCHEHEIHAKIPKPRKIFGRGLKTVNNASISDTIQEKFRIDANIGANIDGHATRREMPCQELAFRTVDVALKGAVEWPINWKGHFIELVSNPVTKAGSSRHLFASEGDDEERSQQLGKHAAENYIQSEECTVKKMRDGQATRNPSSGHVRNRTERLKTSFIKIEFRS